MQERPIDNHLAQLPTLVADHLDALTEDAHEAVALRDRAELRFEGGDPSITVILKEPTKFGPDIARGSAIGDHKIEELGRSACV